MYAIRSYYAGNLEAALHVGRVGDERAQGINWPIIKGEKETGLSIFWPDNGLDTGDAAAGE